MVLGAVPLRSASQACDPHLTSGTFAREPSPPPHTTSRLNSAHAHILLYYILTPLPLLHVVQGAGTAYLFSSAALKANLLKHQASQADLKRILEEMEAGPASGMEGGVNGQETMTDRYASTRGDH